MSLATWFLQRRLRKEIGLSKEEYGMFKKMLLDNWFSTLLAVLTAAADAVQSGIHWRQALIVAIGAALKDNVPGIGKKAGGGQ